ncbi:MAG TPA: hypothetical protein VMR62_08530 [Bryobacteraceae bacterium]|jgi:hypothetical protein|nr:hypothetical protein [Bryobacteraceae bacterium]
MIRSSVVFSTIAVLGLGAAVFARAHRAEDLVDRVQGVRIASRFPCDGATNPQEDVKLETTFSPGGWQRAFHLDVFESQYCKRLDLYFFCVMHGHDRWKHEWEQNSQGPQVPARYWVNTCSAWGSKDAQEYILSGWFQEGAADRKLPWKQAAIKQVSATPEIYEFTDANGGTARLEIKRK